MFRLRDPERCQGRIDPGHGVVAGKRGPVSVPLGGAVLGFGDVMHALAMAGEVEELVGCVFGSGSIEVR